MQPPILDNLHHARVAVWGIGVDGCATVDYLCRYWPQARVTVLCTPAEADAGMRGRWPGVRFATTPVTACQLNRYDLVIKSPGISPYQCPASGVDVPMLGSHALWFAHHRAGIVIAVTGTKGKSTTASLLAHVLRGLGYSVNLAGNIGRPLLEFAAQPADFTVLETSSYQAADGFIRPDIAVLLNLYPEHLDWHGSEARYYQDKMRLLENAAQVIIGSPVEVLHARLSAAGLPASGVIQQALSPRWQVTDSGLFHRNRCIFPANRWRLRGRHNLGNLAVVLSVVDTLGFSVSDALEQVRGFHPLPHRLQSLGRIGQWHWINDSIASTPHATLAALSTVESRNTTLILGGHDRKVDWLEFARSLQSRTPACVVVTGENADRVLSALEQHPPACRVEQAVDLAHAVRLATRYTPTGGNVLLSPGSPSFDAFADYAERGLAFERLARRCAAIPSGQRMPENSA